MKLRLHLAALLAFATPLVASASYELAIVAEQRRIHRYDTDTGAYLGGFGNFNSTIYDIATDPTTGYTFVSEFNQYISKYNYSTGVASSAITVALAPNLNLVNGEVWAHLGNLVTRYDQNLSPLGTFTFSGLSGNISVHYLKNKLFVSEHLGTTLTFRRYSLTGALEATLGTIANVTSAFGKLGNIRYINTNTTDLLSIGVTISGLNRVGYVTLNGINAMTVGAYTPGLVTLVVDAAPTHRAGVFLGRNAALESQGAIAITSPDASVVSIFGTNILQLPVAINTIVAPEPGSLLAFGLGGWLLLRRKR